MISPYIIPIAIICSAFIGFFAAWYNSLIARQSQEISLQINEFCHALDQLKVDAIKYWLNDDNGKNNNTEILIVSSLHSVLLQLSYLKDSLSAFTTPWWKVGFNSDSKNISELTKIHKELHNLITGDEFGVVNSQKSDPEKCRRISSKIDRFKFYTRTYRRRY